MPDMPKHRSTAAEPGQVEPAALSSLRRELARGTAELAVLSILDGGRHYGYELLKLLRPAGGSVLEIREGTLYPLLHRLEDAGHIAATWEAEGRARPRKYYAITPDGRAHLALLRAEWSELVSAVQQLLSSLDGSLDEVQR
jgi:PadR family transcriptional regulator, regulatory protein PadR